MTTADAPRASARKTSAPVRTPESSSSGTRPSTAWAMSGSASRLAGAGSTWRPPWLETRIADAPALTASAADSGVRMPLAIHGSWWRAVASASWSQVQSGMTPPPKVDATFGSPSSVALPNQTPGSKLEAGHLVPDPPAHRRAVDGDAERVVAGVLDPPGDRVERLERVQLPDPGRRRGGRGHVLVGEAADLGHDRRDAAGGVGAGDRQVPVVREQRVAAERGGQHRGREGDAEELGVRLRVVDAAHRPWLDHVAGERLAVGLEGLLGAGAALQVDGHVGGQVLQRRRVDLVQGEELMISGGHRANRHQRTLPVMSGYGIVAGQRALECQWQRLCSSHDPIDL